MEHQVLFDAGWTGQRSFRGRCFAFQNEATLRLDVQDELLLLRIEHPEAPGHLQIDFEVGAAEHGEVFRRLVDIQNKVRPATTTES